MLVPTGRRRMSANPHANGGELMQCRQAISWAISPAADSRWTTLGGHASVDLSAGRVEFEVRMSPIGTFRTC